MVEAFDTDDRTRTFFHGHSFTANPLACAVAVANQRLMITGEWQRQVREMEAFWHRELSPLREQSAVKEVRIRGSIGAVEVDVPGGYLADVGRSMRQKCLEHGVLLRPLGNVLYAMPPFGTDAATLARIATAIRSGLNVV